MVLIDYVNSPNVSLEGMHTLSKKAVESYFKIKSALGLALGTLFNQLISTFTLSVRS